MNNAPRTWCIPMLLSGRLFISGYLLDKFERLLGFVFLQLSQ